MVAARKYTFTRMTVDEFLSWDPRDRSGRLWQLIDGEPVAMAPGSYMHGSIQSEISGLLRDHLLRKGSRCQVVTTPGIVPRIGANRNYRIPDLGVTCAPPSRELLMPDPVLLIEILSPSNENETRANIWAYTTIPTVREILAVRSTRIEAELLRRRGDGSWPEEPDIIGPGTDLSLASIDFTAPLADCYRTTELA